MGAFVFIFGGERAGAGGPNPAGLLHRPGSTIAPTFRRGDYFPPFPDKEMRLRNEITCQNLQPGHSIWETEQEYKEMDIETKQDYKEIESNGKSNEAGGGAAEPMFVASGKRGWLAGWVSLRYQIEPEPDMSSGLKDSVFNK